MEMIQSSSNNYLCHMMNSKRSGITTFKMVDGAIETVDGDSNSKHCENDVPRNSEDDMFGKDAVPRLWSKAWSKWKVILQSRLRVLLYQILGRGSLHNEN